jgi:DNA-binding PadR family transcriptional regulator
MSVKYAILGLLHYKDMHGYRIKKHLERNFGHMWSINCGQIYPNLKMMEEKGLVTATQIPQQGRPNKRLYSITPEGKAAFKRWLESNPEKKMILRDPFLMRLVFFGFGKKERALEIIQEQIQLYEEQLEHRKDNVARWQRHDVYVRLVAELGVNFNEMFLDWLRHAKREISEKLEDEDLAMPAYGWAQANNGKPINFRT